MKTMCPPDHHNGYVANYALGHIMYGCNIIHYVPMCMSCHKAILVITASAHCFHDCIYIPLVLFL